MTWKPRAAGVPSLRCGALKGWEIAEGCGRRCLLDDAELRAVDGTAPRIGDRPLAQRPTGAGQLGGHAAAQQARARRSPRLYVDTRLARHRENLGLPCPGRVTRDSMCDALPQRGQAGGRVVAALGLVAKAAWYLVKARAEAAAQ